MKRTLVLLYVLFALQVHAQKEKAEAYINTYKELAISEMIRSGVPAAITLAQGILESQSGESILAKVSNNHFGIKCKTEWTGAKTYHDDDAKGECFRVYPSAEDSYRDHSDFLKTRPHYAFLFNLDPTDYEGWAKGLKKAGYATSPTYPQKLLKVINDYNLQQYSLQAIARMHNQPAKAVSPTDVTAASHQPPVAEKEASAETVQVKASPGEKEKTEPQAEEKNEAPVVSATASPKTLNYPAGIFTINHSKVILGKEGVSLLSLANQFDIPLGKLIEYNELTPMDILDHDRLLFIEKKQKKGATDFHVVTAGETLYDIAQSEGVRLESLQEYNHLDATTVLKAGDKILLRTVAPVSKTSPRAPR